MASNAPRRTLMGYLGMFLMGQMSETRLFRGPYIRFGRILTVSAFLYETGAILGRARRDKLSILAKIAPVLEGAEDDFINDMQEKARERLEKFGKEPNSFVDFVMSTELEAVGLSLTGSNLKALKKALNEKGSLREDWPAIAAIGIEGIGFGSSFPDLTERMLRRTYDSIDMDLWSKARAFGVNLPERPTIKSFEEREQTVLKEVAIFASKYYPELVDALDLRLA